MPLTEKMKYFCREYVDNLGNGTQAYLTAYNSDSPTAAAIESSRLLARPDIRDYINSLNKPMEQQTITDRQKKIEVLWSIINNPATKDSDKISALNVLNRMQGDYVTLSTGQDEQDNVVNLSDETLRKLNVV
jgi:phage terminase small subunit